MQGDKRGRCQEAEEGSLSGHYNPRSLFSPLMEGDSCKLYTTENGVLQAATLFDPYPTNSSLYSMLSFVLDEMNGKSMVIWWNQSHRCLLHWKCIPIVPMPRWTLQLVISGQEGAAWNHPFIAQYECDNRCKAGMTPVIAPLSTRGCFRTIGAWETKTIVHKEIHIQATCSLLTGLEGVQYCKMSYILSAVFSVLRNSDGLSPEKG